MEIRECELGVELAVVSDGLYTVKSVIPYLDRKPVLVIREHMTQADMDDYFSHYDEVAELVVCIKAE